MTEMALAHPSWRMISWLPGAVLRWVFNSTRMASLVEIDVRPRGSALTFDCGDAPLVDLWLTVRNGTPFVVTLDRLRVDLWCSGRRLGELWFLERIAVPAGTKGRDLLVRGLAGVRYDRLLEKDPRGSIQVRAYFESKVGRFELNTRQLEGIRPELVNVLSRQ